MQTMAPRLVKGRPKYDNFDSASADARDISAYVVVSQCTKECPFQDSLSRQVQFVIIALNVNHGGRSVRKDSRD